MPCPSESDAPVEDIRERFEQYADWNTSDWNAADEAGKRQAVKAMLENIDPQAFAGVKNGVMVGELNASIDRATEEAETFFTETDGMFTMRYLAEQMQAAEAVPAQ